MCCQVVTLEGAAVEIELVDAVAAVRDELLEAAARGAGQGVEFTVNGLELEFEVELRREVTAKAGFKAWVVNVEGGGTAGHVRTHRVKLSLTPRLQGRGDLLIHGDVDAPTGPGDVSGYITP
jgi:hypothetical protein